VETLSVKIRRRCNGNYVLNRSYVIAKYVGSAKRRYRNRRIRKTGHARKRSRDAQKGGAEGRAGRESFGYGKTYHVTIATNVHHHRRRGHSVRRRPSSATRKRNKYVTRVCEQGKQNGRRLPRRNSPLRIIRGAYTRTRR